MRRRSCFDAAPSTGLRRGQQVGGHAELPIFANRLTAEQCASDGCGTGVVGRPM
jgi:hypothetical protein